MNSKPRIKVVQIHSHWAAFHGLGFMRLQTKYEWIQYLRESERVDREFKAVESQYRQIIKNKRQAV